MDRNSFTAGASGTLVPTLNGVTAFVPNDLPPVIDLNLVGIRFAAAMQAIGELKGACRRLRNPNILIGPLQRNEALTSSAMEGTFTTEDELVLAESGIERASDDSTREVRNYIRALNSALRMTEKYSISHRVIKEAHRILLSGLGTTRGAMKRPGEFKQDQNWIGGRTIEVARYIPPPPGPAFECMAALERYINREPNAATMPLMDIALVHYKLEAIHPFADGNGRVGRMLISLMSVASGLLEMPVLYISPVMEQRKDDYIDLMFNVSTRGDWSGWLNFFFDCTVESCRQTIVTIDRLIALEADYREKAGAVTRSGAAISLVERLFEQPAITVSDAQSVLGVTYAAARNTIDRLVEIGALEEIVGIYPKVFLARGVMRAASAGS